MPSPCHPQTAMTSESPPLPSTLLITTSTLFALSSPLNCYCHVLLPSATLAETKHTPQTITHAQIMPSPPSLLSLASSYSYPSPPSPLSSSASIHTLPAPRPHVSTEVPDAVKAQINQPDVSEPCNNSLDDAAVGWPRGDTFCLHAKTIDDDLFSPSHPVSPASVYHGFYFLASSFA